MKINNFFDHQGSVAVMNEKQSAMFISLVILHSDRSAARGHFGMTT